MTTTLPPPGPAAGPPAGQPAQPLRAASAAQPAPPAVLPLGALLLGAAARTLVGGIGYGVSRDYGLAPSKGGLWQLLLLAAAVAGATWAGLVAPLAHLVRHRLSGPRLVVFGVGLTFTAGAAGSVLGGAAHEDQRQAARSACRQGVAAEMREVADAARPPTSPYLARPQGTPTGCRVDVAVPADLADPAGYAAALAPMGFVASEDGTFERAGLLVTVRADAREGGKEYLIAFYGRRR